MSILRIAVCVGMSLSVVSGAVAETAQTNNYVELKIANVQFSVLSEFVYSRKGPTKGSPEHLEVVFSVPGHVPLGPVIGTDGLPRIDTEKWKELRARGEDIIELRLVPERGRLRRLEQFQNEKSCRLVGTFESIELRGVAGYACSSNGVAIVKVFSLSGLAGQAVLICRHFTNLPEGKEGKTCEVVVEGRQDGVSLVLENVDPNSILKFPALVNAAELFVAQKMKQPR